MPPREGAPPLRLDVARVRAWIREVGLDDLAPLALAAEMPLRALRAAVDGGEAMDQEHLARLARVVGTDARSLCDAEHLAHVEAEIRASNRAFVARLKAARAQNDGAGEDPAAG